MSKKIIKYDVITGETPEELSSRVNDAIRDGWQPHGSMSHVASYNQPVIAYEESDEVPQEVDLPDSLFECETIRELSDMVLKLSPVVGHQHHLITPGGEAICTRVDASRPMNYFIDAIAPAGLPQCLVETKFSIAERTAILALVDRLLRNTASGGGRLIINTRNTPDGLALILGLIPSTNPSSPIQAIIQLTPKEK